MKVYIASESSGCCGDYTLGVFLTQELADNYIENCLEKFYEDETVERVKLYGNTIYKGLSESEALAKVKEYIPCPSYEVCEYEVQT